MIQELNITQLKISTESLKEDVVAVEEPLEIQLLLNKKAGYKMHPLSVAMRTPGQDQELAIGFLFTEGIIVSKTDLADSLTYPLGENKILVHLSETATFEPDQLKRNFYTTSSCGVCGKESIEAIHQACRIAPRNNTLLVDKDIVFSLPDRLKEVQKTFISTGGIHAAAFFNANGTLINFREDVGRHNALDKLIGAEILKADSEELNLQDRLLLLSGRASFELIQKAAMAGVRIVCALGAPSSLAVETAQSFGMTLIGFLKSHSANIYCGPERLNFRKGVL